MKKLTFLLLFLLQTIMPASFYALEEPPLPLELQKELQIAESQNDNPFIDKFFHMLLLLGAMIALLYGGMWMIKRISLPKNNDSGSRAEPTRIKILEKRPLSLKTTLYVLEVFGKNIIVAESVNGTSVLTEISTNHEK